MKNIIVLISICLLLISCSHNNYNRENDYTQKLGFFPHAIVEHFPKWKDIPTATDVNVVSVGFKSVNKEFIKTHNPFPFHLFLGIGYKQDTLYYLTKNKLLDTNGYKAISVKDTNYLIALEVPFKPEGGGSVYYENYEDSVKEKEVIARNLRMNNTDVILPIFEQNDLSDIGLSDDYKIYFIDSKRGKFVDKVYYDTDTTISLMPDNWKHGYSRGYALSDKQKEIIYWVVVW
ncbi:MAG: hypothetical protein LBL74_00645 [Bacteroidales bacterium]|jgi:hypothetical protein|nr:hypothetical protein [Bacteroidales bacterium]